MEIYLLFGQTEREVKKTKKKSVEILIGLMLIASLTFTIAFPVLADGNTQMGCVISEYEVTVGDTFNVTVWLNADEPIDSWWVGLLSFNETFLGMADVTSVSIGSFWNASDFSYNGTIDNNNGKITVGDLSAIWPNRT